MDYIDYSDMDPDVSIEDWTYNTFKSYFKATFFKIYKIGGAVPWTMKETVLLSRMNGEFNNQDLADMILYWHVNAPNATVACQFSYFYTDRIRIYNEMKDKTSDYSWE